MIKQPYGLHTITQAEVALIICEVLVNITIYISQKSFCEQIMALKCFTNTELDHKWLHRKLFEFYFQS